MASAIWTLSASVVAIVVGLSDRSLALVAFGAVQLFDFAADVVLVIHFRVGATAAHLERTVLRIVSAGLLATGLTTAVISIVHLVATAGAESSTGSIVLAGASLVALAALAVRKRQLSVRLPSPALRSDGNLSAVGAALAAVTLAGTAASRTFDWWWADPTAALLVALGAIALGAATISAQAKAASTELGLRR